MNKTTIKSAFSKIKADDYFRKETISMMIEEQKKKAQGREGKTKRKRLLMVTVTTCMVLVVMIAWQTIGSKLPFLPTSSNSVDIHLTTLETIENPPTTTELKVIVNSDDYPSSLDSYKRPKQGEFIVSLEVRSALEDLKNAGKYFYVQLYVIPAEQYTYVYDNYVYNGRTIDEWSVLLDLSYEAYPYSEYNGDFGGSITLEEWKQKQVEAKKLSPQENFDAATAEYNSIVRPIIDEAKAACQQSECDRLKQLGYDVSLSQTWDYGNASEKRFHTILTGLLSQKQINEFSANSNFGYFIEWVNDGDGIVNWSD